MRPKKLLDFFNKPEDNHRMKSYQIGYRNNKYYKKFVSKDEYLMLYNNDEKTDERIIQMIKDARVEFNDPDIFDVSSGENERSIETFSAIFESKKVDSPVDDILPGVYDLTYNNQGPILVASNIGSFNKILPIHTELRDIILKANFNDKNNILIYGQPGNGKTQSVIELANTMDDLLIINVLKVEALRSLKNVPEKMKKILIFEEFTETLKLNDKRILLNFLDGIDSVANTISVMSTNYPKELESNIIDRPSRIRHFLEYKNPNEEQIKIICEHHNVNPKFFLKKDYSVDNIINIIKTSKESGISLKDANNQIAAKRKFLSDTFKSNQGGISLMSHDDSDDDITWE